MSLVVVDASVQEARRILAADSHIAVLKIESLEIATPELVRNQFNEIKKQLLTRNSYGIEEVSKAKAKLEQACNSLSSKQQIETARKQALAALVLKEKELEMFRRIAEHTRDLEQRAVNLVSASLPLD